MNKLNTYIILSLFLLVIPATSQWSLFGYDPENCEPTAPKPPKSEGDRYSLSSEGYPLKNGKEYASLSSASYMAGQIFNIAIAQNKSLSSAYAICRNAMGSAYREASRYSSNSSLVDNYQNNLNRCDQLYRKYGNSSSVLVALRNDKTYQRKSIKKADGYYEICYSNGFTSERYSYENNSRDGLYESYYDNAQLKKKTEYADGSIDGDFETYYRSGQLKEKTEYKDGYINGKFESYHENGKLKEKSKYKNRNKNGGSELFMKTAS